MGRLTTHVLDTAQGIPAVGVRVVLRRVAGDSRTEVGVAITNREGRLDRPLLEGDELVAGTYELEFGIEGYFANQPLDVPRPPFLDIVTIRFTVADAGEHYHVPLLVSPWAYSTYRGS
jgi:5-hydroxyisourate hydrolase